MRGSAKRALENFKALDQAQQERVKQALVEALELSAQARAQVIQKRSNAAPPGGARSGQES